MDMTHLFISNLKEYRRNKGLSQKTLAEKCNAAHSYIRQLESGTGHPSFAFIEKLADALNIEPYKLFIDKTTPRSEGSVSSELIETIKTDFLHKVADELDIAIQKLKE